MRTPDVPAGGRRASAAVVTALTVAAVVVGVAAVRLNGTPPATPTPSGPTPAQGDVSSVLRIDLGPGSDPLAVAEECAPEDFAADLGEVEVLYDVVQRSPQGPWSVLVLRNGEGELLLCDLTGAEEPGVLPVPEPTPEEPVAFLTTGRAAWDCDGLVVERYLSTTWLVVHPSVAQVEERYVVDGVPGPWLATQPSAGFAHLQSWLGPQPEGVDVVVERRVLDASGDELPQSALPRRQALPGCTGGDVQIG